MLARAFQTLENERCRQCGMPTYICHNDDPDIEWAMDRGTCYATAAQDKAEKMDEKKRKNARGKAAEEAPPGEEMVPTPYRLSGNPLAALRDPWREAESKRREEIAKSRPGYKGE